VATVNPGASDALDATGTTATALARETRSLDDRLTLLQARMVYIALAFGLACFWFGLVYLQLINENGMWKPPGVHQPTLLVGLFEMGLIQASGIVYFWGQWAGLYQRKFNILTLGLWVAALLGLASFGFHIYELHQPGFNSLAPPLPGAKYPAVHVSQLQTGYTSVFTVTEGVFTILLGASLFVLFGIANRARLGRFAKSAVAVEAFGEFWGFMAAVALLNFLALYVQPFFHSG